MTNTHKDPVSFEDWLDNNPDIGLMQVGRAIWNHLMAIIEARDREIAASETNIVSLMRRLNLVGDHTKWFDEDGACKLCQGEIPHGHALDCFIYKQETRIQELEKDIQRLNDKIDDWRKYGMPIEEI